REIMPDIGQGGRTEEGIDDRMHESVRVRMAVQPFRKRNFHAPQPQRPPLFERMDVKAYPDTMHLASSKSTGRVILRFSAGASTRRTRIPIRSTNCASSVTTRPLPRACARSSNFRANTWGVWASHTESRGGVEWMHRSPLESLTVSLLGQAAIAA